MTTHNRSHSAKSHHLLRVLGVGFGLAVIIGNTIGAGIFRTPGTIAALLPNVWLFLGVWLIGGLYALLGTFQIAELGTMIPRSGGQYVFARHALGEYAGFIVGWSDWVSTCGSTAAVSLVIGEFAGALFPSLSGKSVSIAATIAIVFAVLQWRGVVWGSNVQNVTSLLKALAFVALIVAAFVLGHGPSEPMTAPLVKPEGFVLLPHLCSRFRQLFLLMTAGRVWSTFLKRWNNPGGTFPAPCLAASYLSSRFICLLIWPWFTYCQSQTSPIRTSQWVPQPQQSLAAKATRCSALSPSFQCSAGSMRII